jgi:hypothetical protein
VIPDEKRLPVSLLCLRIGVFVVMALWSVDKIVNPGHAAGVFESFYFIGGLGPGAMAAIGGAQLLVEVAFVAGAFRTFTYGFVLAAHLVSTLASWPGYLEPFDHLLWFAAWPMLAACVALFLLREEDTLWSVDAARRPGAGSAAREARTAQGAP